MSVAWTETGMSADRKRETLAAQRETRLPHEPYPFASRDDMERARAYLAIGSRPDAEEVARQWSLRTDGPDYQPLPIRVAAR